MLRLPAATLAGRVLRCRAAASCLPATVGRRLQPQLLRAHSGHSHSHFDDEDDGNDHHQRPATTTSDARAADSITWTGIYVNVALSGVKGAAGVACHSAALLADAAHSLSDLVSDAITLAALRYCARPADAHQPYGYGKYETVGALAVSLLLVGGSLGIIGHSLDTLLTLLQPPAAVAATSLETQLAASALEPEVIESIKALATAAPESSSLHHHHVHSVGDTAAIHPAALAIAAASVASKEALYRATIRIGRKVNSSVLIANAWHHRSDAATSGVAMAGIGLSLAGLPMFDPLAGMLVGGIILKMGGDIGYSATKELCDAQLPDKIVHSIERAVDGVVRESCGAIVAVRQLRSRRIGRSVHVDLTLVMAAGDEGAESSVSFQTACLWKEKVKSAVRRQVPRVKDIIVELATPEQASSTVFQELQQLRQHGHSHSHGASPVGHSQSHHHHNHNHGHGHSHNHHGHGHSHQHLE